MMFPLSGGYRPTKLLAGGSGRGASSQWMSMSMKIYITRPGRMCMMKNLMMKNLMVKNLSCPLPPHHYEDSEVRIVEQGRCGHAAYAILFLLK